MTTHEGYEIAIKKLTQVGAPRLAQELVELSFTSEQAGLLIERLLISPADSIALFKKRLTAIKRRKSFVRRGGARAYYGELSNLLGIINEVPTAECLPLLVKLYEADASLIEKVDDSDGEMTDFYSQVTDKFCACAEEGVPQAKLIQISKKLFKSDSYGVRGPLLDKLHLFMEQPSLRKLFDYYREQKSELERFGHKLKLESLAFQLKDPALYEYIVLEDVEGPNHYHFIKIATCYLANDDAETALRYVQKCPNGHSYEQHKLLEKIYQKLEMKTEYIALLTSAFSQSPTAISFRNLESVAGAEVAQKALSHKIENASASEALNLQVLRLMAELGLHSEAKEYLMDRVGQLDGDYYYELAKIEKYFRLRGDILCVSLIIRALMSSILYRGISKNYYIAVKYLTTLYKLQHEIDDWKGSPDHTEFLTSIHSIHYRKTAFWSKVTAEQMMGL